MLSNKVLKWIAASLAGTMLSVGPVMATPLHKHHHLSAGKHTAKKLVTSTPKVKAKALVKAKSHTGGKVKSLAATKHHKAVAAGSHKHSAGKLDKVKTASSNM